MPDQLGATDASSAGSVCSSNMGDADANILRSEIQVGLPLLFGNGTPDYFTLLKSWLADCDANHPGCGHGPDRSSRGVPTHPTRLIDIGTTNNAIVRLIDTEAIAIPEKQKLRYVALSYQWGHDGSHQYLYTTKTNVAAHRTGIDLNGMPRLFRDVITTIRHLGLRFLWIDSLCIIQGKDGDFQQEAARMDAIFSGAYCVIAASRASGTSDGILEERVPRKFVEMPSDLNSKIFVCEDLDDFQHDVIDGELSQRGWVLQERALARRTIYFCAQQTYWECGQGIRCETFTKMNNKQASFLGDPDFPRVAERDSKGARIRLYQALYEQYSRLKFSHDSDRPVAIAGLEQRLLKAFSTGGGFGVFVRYLPRCILWCRADDQPLVPISFPAEQEVVPSWSWMKYKGAITFLDAPFGDVEWNNPDFAWPWANLHTALAGSTKRMPTGIEKRCLRVTLRDFDPKAVGGSAVGGAGTHQIRLDRPSSGHDGLKCVVVGKHKAVYGSNKSTCYVLLVEKEIGGEFYARRGVGIMPQSCIRFADSGCEAFII